MPWSPAQIRLFMAAAHSTDIAESHGMTQEKAKEMAKEGVKSDSDTPDQISRMDAENGMVRNDAEHWITLHPNGKEGGGGTPALINGAGQIIGGAGGKLNGKIVSPKSKSEGRAGTHEQHAPALWLGKAKEELPNNGGAESSSPAKELTASEKAHELSKSAKTSQEHAEARKAHEQQIKDLHPDDPLKDSHRKQAHFHMKEGASVEANELSETAKTAEEHKAAREAHVRAANLLSKSAEPEKWMHHYEQHKVHEKAAKKVASEDRKTEKKSGLGLKRIEAESKYLKHDAASLQKDLSNKFNIGFQNFSESKKEAKKVLDEIRGNRDMPREQLNELIQKHNDLQDKARKEMRAPRGCTPYDVNSGSVGAKAQLKMIGHIDSALDHLSAQGFDIKSALAKGNVKIASVTTGKANGISWQGHDGVGYFAVSHSKRGNFDEDQINRAKFRKEQGKVQWSCSTNPDHPEDATRATITHELAHALGMQKNIDSTGRLNLILNDMEPDYSKRQKWIHDNLSEYATTNIRETDAELCAMVTAPYYKRGTLPKELEDHVDWLFMKARE